MKADYSLGYGFMNIIINQTNIDDEEQRGDTRLRLIADRDVYKNVFCATYEKLVSNKEILPIEAQNIEYKKELWELANHFLPEDSDPLKVRFCKAVMGFLWLINN